MTERLFQPTQGLDPSEVARRLSENIAPRDRAAHLLRHTLLEQQLAAIKALIRRNQEVEATTLLDFEELDNDPGWNRPDTEYLEIARDARFWQMTFQASAHSMAAVGMLAPFVESLFVAIFDGLRRVPLVSPGDSRQRGLNDEQLWNPQWFLGSKCPRKDLCPGIKQLADATGLQPHLPDGYERALSALFTYRNNMFHNGFEWPDTVREKFAKRVASGEWPQGWFDHASRNHTPWLFYMTPAFLAHCIDMIDGILGGVGRFMQHF